MANRLEYLVPPPPFPGAREEFEALIRTLHESGALRFLNGFFGRLGPINEVAFGEATTPQGKNLIGTLLFVGECLAKMPVDHLQRVGSGFAAGLQRAGEVMNREPPGTIALLRILDDPETRRSIAAMVALMNTVTGAIGQNEAKH